MRRHLLVSFALSLALHAGLAVFVSQPGYMDAYYYYNGGVRLAEGHGFTEQYLWNYLDDPAGLPHPSHLYWMPLTSIVAAAPMMLLGSTFRVAQLPFILLAASIAPLTLWIAHRLTRDFRQAWAAGLFATFSGFYFPYMTNIDAFALYGLVGTGAILLTAKAGEQAETGWSAFVAGLLAGLASLARADGLLLGLCCFGWLVVQLGKGQPSRKVLVWARALSFFAGMLVVMGPWWLRNITVVGSPFAPGGVRAAWLLSYDELFRFPASELSAERFFGQGLGGVLRSRLEGMWGNLQTVVAVQGSIFLAPLIGAGLWQVRHRPEYRLALLYFSALFLAMTLVFTYPGVRGGLFHSSTALLPFFLAAAPVGLNSAVGWVAQRRASWNAAQAERVFSAGAVILAAGLTIVLAGTKVVGADPSRSTWAGSDAAYSQVGVWMSANLAGEPIVMANNPPGFLYHTGRPSIVIPDGGVQSLLEAADRYGAEYVLLEANHPSKLTGLYMGAEPHGRLELAQSFLSPAGPAMLYRILPNG